MTISASRNAQTAKATIGVIVDGHTVPLRKVLILSDVHAEMFIPAASTDTSIPGAMLIPMTSGATVELREKI